ncbi:MAG TPA: NAD-dependent epimerase/dehydratase family protein [Candidatus Saccharimonadales bacterium]|nr:NAD-dependent epimerase/dehydratase family protein [Candidatus Saccharimonadales bacterium]
MPETAPQTVKNSQPTALVAGAAGFIGAQLCSTLVSQNFRVLAVDNLSSGKKENLKDLLTSPNFTFIEADINNAAVVLPEGVKLDYIFHLAAVEEYKSQKSFSLDTLLVNSLGTRELLELAKAQGAKFILASSADLYSGAISSSSLRYYFGKTPGEEAILSSHEAKRFSEALAFEYYNKFKVAVTIIRLKDAYGPKMNLERGDEIANLLKEALEGRPLTLVGDGLKIIHPTYVSDLIFSLIKAAVGDFNGEIFILVHPDKVTLEKFAHTIKQVTPEAEIEHKKEKDNLEFSTDHFDLDNTKEKLGWNPKVSLAEGIGATLQSFQIKSNPETTVVENEPEQRAAEQAPLTPTKEVAAEKSPKQKRSRSATLVRVAVFTFSALLIFSVLVYPLFSVGVNGYLGTRELKEATSAFENNQNEEASKVSLSSQKHFETAANSLGNVNWALKILWLAKGEQALDQDFATSAALAQSIRLSSAAGQKLFSSADNPNLTAAEAKKSLEDTLDDLSAAEDQISVVKLDLGNLNEKELVGTIAPSKSFLVVQSETLEKENEQLSESIKETLSKLENQ